MTPGLGRYVPRRVLDAIAAERPPRTQPGEERVDGVAMVVDIVGFSSLSEEFARSGPPGAERLSAILDRYFGRMTGIAIAHRGDVVDFVGDAMLVTWQIEGTLANTASLAAQCGLALQAALPEIAALSGVALGQRIAIDAGPISYFELGGVEGKWHCLAAGTPLREAALSCHHAAPGEVIAAPRAWDAVRTRCEGREMPSGRARLVRVLAPLPLAEPPADEGGSLDGALECYLPQPLLERLRAGGSRWFGEFRDVTTLFLGLPEIDFTQPRAAESLQLATACVQHAHRRYGGSLTRPSIDDKGVVLLSAFGLPLTAREDDAQRAVHAALAILDELRERAIPSAIGMTTGRVFYGDTGGERRRHVGMVGVTVNTAARLMMAAGPGILCDEATRRAAERAFEFEEQPPLVVKGRDEPLSPWRPRAKRTRARQRFAGALIGRDAERRMLGERLEALAGRSGGGLIFLRGEAGIGKSRLIAHAVAEAKARGIRVLACAGTAVESASAYFPWRQVLGQLLSGDEPLDPARGRRRLEGMLAGRARLQAWAPLLNDLLPLGLEENSLTREITGAARASSLQALFRALLTESARGAPVLLVADDLHWFDGASAAALGAATRDLRGVLVLAGTRPLDSSAPAQVADLLQDAWAAVVGIDALSGVEAGRLLCDKLAVAHAQPELADFVFARTSGNPFYVEELVLALRTAGLIDVGAAAVALAPGVEPQALEALPGSLRGVIVSRVDALGAVEQLSLKVAAVIGREFSLAMLRDLHPRAGEADLQSVIGTLLREDIVRPAPPGARGEYAFKHAILQDVVYDQLPFALRRELHGGAAAWIERGEAANLEPYYSELALHWERAEQGGKAIEYREKAAHLALTRHANRETLGHVRKAIELAERHGMSVDATRAARWEALLGEARHELFEYGPAAGHFRRALALAGRPVPGGRGALAAALGAELVSQVAARAGLALRTGGEPGRTLQWASHIHERLAEIAYFDNRPGDLLHATLASLNLAERAGALRETVEGFAALSIGLQQVGARGISRYYNRRSIAVAESAGSLADLAYAHLVDCVFQATRGGWVDLARSHARAAAIYRQLGATVRWHQTHSVLYTSLGMRGLFDQAALALGEARAALAHDTPAQVRSWISAAEMVVALARGAPSDALVAELEAVQGAGLHRADLLQCKGLAAHARAAEGRMDDALRGADEALALLESAIPTAWHVTPGLAAIAEVYLAAWEADRGSRTLARSAARACRFLQRFSRYTPISAPRAALIAGRDAWLRGRPRRACALWRRAEEAAGRLQMPWDRDLAARELAAHAVPGGLSHFFL